MMKDVQNVLDINMKPIEAFNCLFSYVLWHNNIKNVPGAAVERMSPLVREQLLKLTSDDMLSQRLDRDLEGSIICDCSCACGDIIMYEKKRMERK